MPLLKSTIVPIGSLSDSSGGDAPSKASSSAPESDHPLSSTEQAKLLYESKHASGGGALLPPPARIMDQSRKPLADLLNLLSQIDTLGGAASIQANFSGADTVIVATIVRKFLFWIFAKPGLERMEDLKGKVFGTTRFGTLSDLAARFALRAHGIDPERDITMVQTGGPAEAITAMVAGKIDAAALSPPATLTARKFKLRELLDMSKLEAEYHINGVVTTRRYLKTQEDVVRRFLKAYIEGAARGQKDKNFALKVMGKYFRTDDKEILEESYETTIKSNFSIPPYPSIPGIASLIQGLEKQNPKAKGAKPEDFADSRLMRELDQSGFVKSVLQ